MGAAFCENHAFEMAEDLCGQCGRDYCPECLVYPFGPKKAPYCKSCALALAGIRKHAAVAPALSKRELKRRRRERKAAAKHQPSTPPPLVPEIDWQQFETAPAMPEPDLGAPTGTPEPSLDLGELEDVRPTFDRGLARLRS